MADNNDRRMSSRSPANELIVYPKDSFDRFGDDLCEVLLTYLSLEYRYRFECVSKQWQRLIFSTQSELIMSAQLAAKLESKDLTRFEALLKKCPNIRHVFHMTEGLTDGMIDLMVKYCKHMDMFIARIDGNVKVVSIHEVFQTYGKQLKAFDLMGKPRKSVDKYVDKNMSFCGNIVEFNALNSSLDKVFAKLFCTGSAAVFPRLRKLTFMHCFLYDNVLDQFATNYGHTLRAIYVEINFMYVKEGSIEALFECLSQMPALIDISIHYNVPIKDHMFVETVDGFKRLGPKCPQLKRLWLWFNKYLVLTRSECEDIFGTINANFRRLSQLEMAVHIAKEFAFTKDTLKQCNRLTYIGISFYINDSFLPNIHKYFPRLEFLWLNNTDVTDEGLDSVTKLPKIQSIKLLGAKGVSESGLKKLTDNYLKIKKLTLNIER